LPLQLIDAAQKAATAEVVKNKQHTPLPALVRATLLG
jgi:hypothetical protein